MIGFARFLNSELDAAILAFRQVLVEYPEIYYDMKAETHYFIGYLYEQKKEPNKAFAEYKNALSLYPKSIWADALRNRVQEIVQAQQAAQ